MVIYTPDRYFIIQFVKITDGNKGAVIIYIDIHWKHTWAIMIDQGWSSLIMIDHSWSSFLLVKAHQLSMRIFDDPLVNIPGRLDKGVDQVWSTCDQCWSTLSNHYPTDLFSVLSLIDIQKKSKTVGH